MELQSGSGYLASFSLSALVGAEMISDDDSDNDNDDDSVVLSGPDCPPTLTDADIETERRSEPRTAFTTQVDWTLSCP